MQSIHQVNKYDKKNEVKALTEQALKQANKQKRDCLKRQASFSERCQSFQGTAK